VNVDPAFEALYEEEFRAVFRAAYLLSGDRELAEDAAQEAFARALERWRRLKGEPWAGGWVMTTALNVVRRSLRRRGEPGNLESPEPGNQTLDEAIDLWRGVRDLPRRQREAVVLHHVLDLPVADCGRIMRCSAGSVKRHLSRARAALARRLVEETP
jgi:RNA polymerase sigma-70 factor, ECF subfamily